jgi:hypothetical protein
MARLQILELPEGSGDDRPPFVLVVDQWDIDSLDEHTMLNEYWDEFGKKIGARGVLFVDCTIDIPANDTTAYIAASEAQTAPPTLGQQLAHERTDIARDMDRLAKWRDELADALGIDRGSSWDDIRNTAAQTRNALNAQVAEVQQLRAGEEPVTDEGVAPNPGQWIWHWNRATPEKRLSMAAQIQDGMIRSNNCFMAEHEAKIEHLSAELEQLRAKNPNA